MPPSSPIPSPSSLPANSSGGSSTVVAVGVSVSIVALIVIGATFFFFWRRRKGFLNDGVPTLRRGSSMKPGHPASRITPFPAGVAPFTLRNDIPRLAHRPGENMRVATRRTDGGWDFSRPLNFTPASRSFDSLSCSSPSSYFSSKDNKYLGELTTRGFLETDAEGIPPPAYCARTSLGAS